MPTLLEYPHNVTVSFYTTAKKLGRDPMLLFAGTFRSDEGPQAIAELVDRCLDDDPAMRPTAREVLDILSANKPTYGHSSKSIQSQF